RDFGSRLRRLLNPSSSVPRWEYQPSYIPLTKPFPHFTRNFSASCSDETGSRSSQGAGEMGWRSSPLTPFLQPRSGGPMNKEVTRRSVIRGGGVIFASGATGVLEALLSACNAATQSSSSSSSSNSSDSSSASCVQATNVTRGPYFIDDRSDPNITGDVV